MDELREERAQLQVQIAWLREQLFGGGKSEKLDRAQLLLKLGELEKLAAASPGVPRLVAAHERAAPVKRTAPAETFAHLPVRETIVIEPPEVRAAPERYEKIGEERTFEVDSCGVPPQILCHHGSPRILLVVRADVGTEFVEARRIADDVIEGFFLPDSGSGRGVSSL